MGSFLVEKCSSENVHPIYTAVYHFLVKGSINVCMPTSIHIIRHGWFQYIQMCTDMWEVMDPILWDGRNRRKLSRPNDVVGVVGVIIVRG